jgi:hypothetical protein
MRGKAGLIALCIALAGLGFAAAALIVPRASAHSNPCHTQHTCPSDHHTYVWTDPTTGLQWDCVKPGAPEFNPFEDQTFIYYGGLTYVCRAAGQSNVTTVASTTTTPSDATTATEPTSTSTTTLTTPGPGQPSIILPNPKITPGVLNPKVRQSTIKMTMCKGGWTKTIRPPVSYTNTLKTQQMMQYGEAGSPSEYEEDHFIPLELGGAPKNPKNLWPEPHSQSRLSDPLETKLKRQVCKGLMKLAKARAAIRLFKNTEG